MNSGANFIAIFCIWIIAIVAAVNFFMPYIEQSIAGINAYSSFTNDIELREQIGLDADESYVSFTPLGIFDLLQQ